MNLINVHDYFPHDVIASSTQKTLKLETVSATFNDRDKASETSNPSFIQKITEFKVLPCYIEISIPTWKLTYPLKKVNFEDDFPLPQVGYVSVP